MARPRIAWALSLPLAAVGWLSAHSLAYRIVEEPAGHHSEVHGYLPYAQVVAVAAVVVALAYCVAAGMRRAPRERPPLVPFALVPFAGFALQEHCERLLSGVGFPLEALLEPTFLIGMALQIPFALVSLLLARALLVLGDAIGSALAGGFAPRLSLPPFLRSPAPEAELSRIPALALGHAERGPPRLFPA